MDSSSIRVLVVEDFAPFREFICSTLRKRPSLQIVGEVSDGLEAVRQAEELKPDLILLDIGLPTLNGIAAARQICKRAPESKIIFVSQESSPDVAQEALSLGARGYVLKTRAASDLLAAMEAVLHGAQFVSPGLLVHNFSDAAGTLAPSRTQAGASIAGTEKREIPRNHEVQFYSDDASFLVGLTRFVKSALEAGNAVIVVATESHRDSLLPRLQTHGLDIGAAIEQGRYIPVDAADTLSALMLNGMPDPVRFLNLLGNLLLTASKAATGKQARVSIFGECVHLLWAQGNAEAAIQFEKLGNQLAKIYDVDILCGYPLASFHGAQDSHIFQRICAEHSAVHSQ
jgi:DNA-binding NarL/FixJ family response regulator